MMESKTGSPFLLKAHQPVRQPRDGVGLAAARGVLHQVLLACALLLRVGQQLANDVELVIARPYLGPAPLPGLRIGGLDELGVVLKDVGQALPGERLAPQVLGHETVGIDRVARATVPSLVERQEPRRLARELRAEPHLLVVDREVRHAAAQLEQVLTRVAVASLYCCSASATVCFVSWFFSSKVATGRPLMNSARSRDMPGLFVTVVQLAGYGEPVQRVERPRPLIPRRRGLVEERDCCAGHA